MHILGKMELSYLSPNAIMVVHMQAFIIIIIISYACIHIALLCIYILASWHLI